MIHAVEAHHNDVEPKTVIACLVQAADAISAARPGARRENVESFIKRLEKLEEIAKEYPTPFHLYDEKGIRENARALKEAFSWNPGFKEYFAVKATPNPFILKILQDMGCGTGLHVDFVKIPTALLSVTDCIDLAVRIVVCHCGDHCGAGLSDDRALS